jgi:hypothetical protein
VLVPLQTFIDSGFLAASTPKTTMAAELTVHVKLGSQEHHVVLPANSTVQQLKQKLEPPTSIMQRHQKLIFKGKVLEDQHSLDDCKLVSGAKLMLLAAQASPKQHMFGTRLSSLFDAELE